MFENMISNRGQLAKTILALFLGLAAALLDPVHAETTAQLDLSPERCVALNEGQTCYQTVLISWQADHPADYCLVREPQEAPLVCWENRSHGKAKMEFASSETVTFRLRLTDKVSQRDIDVAESAVIVTWVYSDTKRRRNSWRLF